jgi:general secretion pathway protein H
MPIGSPRPDTALRQVWRGRRGLTLLELLVVLGVLALASGGVVWRLHDPTARQLQQEASRLAAVLEAARSQSRARGQALRWRTTPDGYAFDGAAQKQWPAHWLFEDTQAQVWGAPALLLGPEPVIGGQAVAVVHGPTGRSVWVLTDGVRPFKVQWPTPTPAAGSVAN